MNKLSKLAVAISTGVFMLNSTVLAKPAASSNGISTVGNNESQIEKLDNQIETSLRTIENNKKDINNIQGQIKDLEKDLSSTDSDLKARQEIFNQRIRAAYISGINSYLDILLNSKDLQDFVWRVDSIRKIVQFDNKVMSDLNTKKEKLAANQKQLKDKKDKLVAIKTENENKLSKLKIDKENQQKLLAKSPARMYAVASSSRNNLSRGGLSIASGSSSDVVSYAYNFIGTPYVWGGSSPSGFDCSGFTSYVYGHFGVGLGRTTYDQVGEGTSVSRDNLQPGDLVLFGSAGNPHHVGIYVGNGNYIHAPRTGDVVRVSSLDRSDFLTGRRVK